MGLRSPEGGEFLADWDYELPEERVASHPPEQRDGGRLLLVPRGGGLVDASIKDLPAWLQPGDVLVLNDTKVVPARLRGQRSTGGEVELLLLLGTGPTTALIRPGRRLKEGEVLRVTGGEVRLGASLGDGEWVVHTRPEPLALLEAGGEVPLPPYLHRPAEPRDRERYQTVYARVPGSSAAPTAGLHLTDSLLDAVRASGVEVTAVTLHVGPATFRPLRPEDLAAGTLHAEAYDVPATACEAIARARARGGRVVAVGTTAVRAVESATPAGSVLPVPTVGLTRVFLTPDRPPRCVNGLLTNFHLPRSSLLMLVASLTGRERLLQAYSHALRSGYRFTSYGDAMLTL